MHHMRQHPGIRVKELMDSAGLSEGELARRTRLQQPTVHRLISQETRSPKRETLQPIADYFGMTIDDLEASTGPKGPKLSVVREAIPPYLAEKIHKLPPKQRDYLMDQIDSIVEGLLKL